jgi:7,8-dihydropterin-6-yl-methyl-4-(beta-D-ribofuranosyl)aminobenzene 5'-phosphate synthase
MEGVTSTGEIGGWASEHSLVANVKDKGLVILTGCGHPRIVNIVRRAQQVSGVSRVHAIIGGFHISVREALEAANLLGKIGAELVSPCHYTSENVKKVMPDKLGTRCVKNGSGKIFSID